MHGHKRILAAFAGSHWYLQPEKAEAVAAFFEAFAVGENAPMAARPTKAPTTEKSIQVIPVTGMIVQRANLISEFSGGTSTEMLGKQIAAAVNDPGIAAIILDVDSPGGEVYGIPELSQQIYDWRKQKPIWAIANSMAASGGYYLATSAEKLFVTPSGEVGSVGVVSVHEDRSAAASQEGVKYTIIRSGRYKAEGSSFEPLTKEAREFIQQRNDEYYEMFVADLARNREMKRRDVQANFGEGRVFGAREAKARGMVDGTATLDEVIAKLRK